jgi:isocitrate dehydrogenase kinase/phosphatase
LKRVTALGTEEMAIVPVMTKSNHMLFHDWGRAMLASWCKIFMPVKMAIEAKPFVAVFSHCLALDFRELLAMLATLKSSESFASIHVWLWPYLERLETGTTTETDKTLGMEIFRRPS